MIPTGKLRLHTAGQADLLQARRGSHIENKVKQIEEIQSVHDIHLWSMDGFYNILTIHIVLNSNEDLYAVSEIKRKIRQNLKQENIQHITMEFENAGEECLQNDC